MGRHFLRVLEGGEWRKLLKSIPDATLRDLRDRALIATLTYSFARINAALRMKVEGLRSRGAGWTIRLHEKGCKQHSMPCHHALAESAARLHRRGRHRRRPQGLAVPDRARAQRQHPLRSGYEPAGRVVHDPAARVIYSFKGRGQTGPTIGRPHSPNSRDPCL